MRKFAIIYIIPLLLAVIFSTFIVTSTTTTNVSACVQSPGCVSLQNQPYGKITVDRYGFPVTYRETVTFQPNNSNQKAANYAGYSSASTTTMQASYIDIAISVLFWLSLLHVIAKFFYHKTPGVKKNS